MNCNNSKGLIVVSSINDTYGVTRQQAISADVDTTGWTNLTENGLPLSMDDFMLLNMEVTPEIEQALVAHLCKASAKQYRDFILSREKDGVSVDTDDLAYLIELQLFIEKAQSRIEECEAKLEGFKTNRVSKDVWSSWNNAKWSNINNKRKGIEMVRSFTALKGDNYRRAMWRRYFRLLATQEKMVAVRGSVLLQTQIMFGESDGEGVVPAIIAQPIPLTADEKIDLLTQWLETHLVSDAEPADYMSKQIDESADGLPEADYIEAIKDAHLSEMNPKPATGNGYWSYANHMRIKNQRLTLSIKLNRPGLMFSI